MQAADDAPTGAGMVGLCEVGREPVLLVGRRAEHLVERAPVIREDAGLDDEDVGKPGLGDLYAHRCNVTADGFVGWDSSLVSWWEARGARYYEGTEIWRVAERDPMKATRTRRPASRRRRRPRKGGRSREYEDRRVRWASLARSFEGRFVEAEKGNFDAIYLPHRDWWIKVDTYLASNGNQAVPYTRVRAFFTAQDRFRVRATPSNALTRLLERIGFKDVKVGDPRIDRRYVIKGPDGNRIRSFFLDGRLRAVLGDQQPCHLEVKDLPWRERRSWGPRVGEVYIRAKGEFIESARLKDLIRLCQATLDRLTTSGAASGKAPVKRGTEDPAPRRSAEPTGTGAGRRGRAGPSSRSVPHRQRRP